jgi:acetylornithine deacetylase/succinyl-diaminopimelate desuccinylase-like protein
MGEHSIAADERLTTRDLAELREFLRIPSISADAARRDSVAEAAAWVAGVVREAGGDATVLDWHGAPLVDATLLANGRGRSPATLLCYGHVDVQPPEPLDLWESDPFEACVRDGWLVARGVADDKGQLWALLRAARDLADANALPVNVRFCCDGEEEIGGSAIVDFLEENARTPAACLIFDTPMLDDTTHVFTTATRGTLYLHVEVRTGIRDLHSGTYGGAALNALHVLVAALGRLFSSDGRIAEALYEGTVAPLDSEAEAWQSLPEGRRLLAAVGAAEADGDAARDFYQRTWALPSLDVNGIEGGSPTQPKTIVVAEARANLSLRLAQGQTVDRVLPIVERELRHGLPEAASLEVTPISSCDPGRVASESRPLQLAAHAFERVLGRRPLLLRSGGSLPLMPLLERHAIPAIVTGFAVPDSNMHAPNERIRMSDLADAVAAARETLLAFAVL